MSERLEKAAAALQEKIDGSGFRGTVRFDITGDGQIHVEDEMVATGNGEADCTIIATMETLRELFEGILDPAAAFMTGKIKVRGNMGMAMRFAQSL